jgi:hypothetical protein
MAAAMALLLEALRSRVNSVLTEDCDNEGAADCADEED